MIPMHLQQVPVINTHNTWKGMHTVRYEDFHIAGDKQIIQHKSFAGPDSHLQKSEHLRFWR